MKTKTINTLNAALIFILIFSSCGTSEKVVSEGWIQKRKYNKGWHIDGFAKDRKHPSAKMEDSSGEPQYQSSVYPCSTGKIENVPETADPEKETTVLAKKEATIISPSEPARSISQEKDDVVPLLINPIGPEIKLVKAGLKKIKEEKQTKSNGGLIAIIVLMAILIVVIIVLLSPGISIGKIILWAVLAVLFALLLGWLFSRM